MGKIIDEITCNAAACFNLSSSQKGDELPLILVFRHINSSQGEEGNQEELTMILPEIKNKNKK